MCALGAGNEALLAPAVKNLVNKVVSDQISLDNQSVTLFAFQNQDLVILRVFGLWFHLFQFAATDFANLIKGEKDNSWLPSFQSTIICYGHNARQPV